MTERPIVYKWHRVGSGEAIMQGWRRKRRSIYFCGWEKPKRHPSLISLRNTAHSESNCFGGSEREEEEGTRNCQNLDHMRLTGDIKKVLLGTIYDTFQEKGLVAAASPNERSSSSHMKLFLLLHLGSHLRTHGSMEV